MPIKNGGQWNNTLGFESCADPRGTSASAESMSSVQRYCNISLCDEHTHEHHFLKQKLSEHKHDEDLKVRSLVTDKTKNGID